MTRDRLNLHRRYFEIRRHADGFLIARTRGNFLNTQGRLALQKALVDGTPLFDWKYGVVSSSVVEPAAGDTALDSQVGTGVLWTRTFPDDATIVSTAVYSAGLGTGTWSKAGSSHGIDGTGLIASQLFDVPQVKTSGDNWDLVHRWELVW